MQVKTNIFIYSPITAGTVVVVFVVVVFVVVVVVVVVVKIGWTPDTCPTPNKITTEIML